MWGTGLSDLVSRSHNLLLFLLLRVVRGAELKVSVQPILAFIHCWSKGVVKKRLRSLHLGFFVLRRLLMNININTLERKAK